MKRIALILLVTAVTLLIDSQAEAQRRVPHYQRTPTMSPYVNLFRADNGGLNSFIGNYQPSQRLRQFVSDTNREFYYQQRAVSQESIRLSQEIAGAAEDGDLAAQQGLVLRPTSTAGSVPRTAGSFLQHTRYFPNSPGATGGGGGVSYSGRGGGRRTPMSRGAGGIGMGGAGGIGMGGIDMGGGARGLGR